MAAMHNVAATTQRTERHVLCASLFQFEESMCIDQRQDIHTACFHCTWQPWKVCMHNKTLSRALWQFTISAEDFQHSSYVCKLGCSLGLVHKGRQACIMLWTTYQSSGWFASTNDRVSYTSDRFSTVTESPKQLLCALQARLRNLSFILPCRNISKAKLMQHALDVDGSYA